MKKTKAQLAEELHRAEHTIQSLKDQIKRSTVGTFDEQIEDIERQIEVFETEASMDITRIIERCEAKTGRRFTYNTEAHQKVRLTKITLKEMVKQLAEKASHSGYTWKRPCDFRKWAEPIFTKEWERTRKEKK